MNFKISFPEYPLFEFGLFIKVCVVVIVVGILLHISSCVMSDPKLIKETTCTPAYVLRDAISINFDKSTLKCENGDTFIGFGTMASETTQHDADVYRMAKVPVYYRLQYFKKFKSSNYTYVAQIKTKK